MVRRYLPILGAALLIFIPVFAHVQVSKLAEQLLFGDQPTKNKALKEFNKLSSDAQYKLVPDFMVALSDEDPNVRKIASRILKAMGVTTENQIPDAAKQAPIVSSPTAAAVEDKWAAEKKMKEETIPDVRKEAPPTVSPVPSEEPLPDADGKWSDLTKMRGEEDGRYLDLKQQIDSEKKGQVTLDASELKPGSDSSPSGLSTVVESLNDPDPWVRTQAARRLSSIQPAPMEAIPILIKMLGDKDPESRRAAVAALGSFGHLATDAVIPLNASLSDPDPAVRTLAGDALKQIQQR